MRGERGSSRPLTGARRELHRTGRTCNAWVEAQVPALKHARKISCAIALVPLFVWLGICRTSRMTLATLFTLPDRHRNAHRRASIDQLAGLRHCLLKGKSHFCFARLSFKWTARTTEQTLKVHWASVTKFEEQYALQVSRCGKQKTRAGSDRLMRSAEIKISPRTRKDELCQLINVRWIRSRTKGDRDTTGEILRRAG